MTSRQTTNSDSTRLLNSRLSAHPEVISTVQGDVTVLMDLRGGNYYTLNDVGSRVWTLLRDGATVDALVATLATEYTVPTGTLRADVLALLDRLMATSLIVCS